MKHMAFAQITEEGTGNVFIINTDDITIVTPREADNWATGCYVTLRDGASRYSGFYLNGRETELLMTVLKRCG